MRPGRLGFHIGVTLCLLAVPAGWAQPSYTVEILPNLVTDEVTYDQLKAFGLTKRGVVVGHATSTSPTHNGNVIFRYRRGRIRMLDSGGFSATVSQMNERGVVVGRVGSGNDSRYFTTRRGRKATFLEGGLTEAEIGRLRTNDLGPKGEVLAYLPDEFFSEPYMHRGRGHGWERITGDHPLFESAAVFPEGINASGDLLLNSANETGSGGGAYILAADGSVEVVRPESEGIVSVRNLTNARSVSGVAVTDGAFKAFYYTPSSGLLALHPDGFFESSASRIAKDGSVLVGARNHGPATLFFFHPDEGRSQVWPDGTVKRLAEEVGCRKPDEADVPFGFINSKREILGRFDCNGKGGSVYHSEATGPILMRDILIAHGAPFRVPKPIAMNERGQILLSVFDGERLVPVLLTPSG